MMMICLLSTGYDKWTTLLNSLPIYNLGGNFLIMTRKALIKDFIKVVSF